MSVTDNDRRTVAVAGCPGSTSAYLTHLTYPEIMTMILYNSETWTLDEEEKRKLKVLEMSSVEKDLRCNEETP